MMGPKVGDSHKVHDISIKEANIFASRGDMVLAEIDEDEEHGLPIFAVCKDNGSKAVFHFGDNNGAMRVLYVSSEEKGDMKDIMDWAVKRFGVHVVVFFNIIGSKLVDVVEPLAIREVEVQGEELAVGITKWEPEQ